MKKAIAWAIVAMAAFAIIAGYAETVYLEIVYPCTKWEIHGSSILMFGGRVPMEVPNRVCVSRDGR